MRHLREVGVVLVAGQKVSVLWRAFRDTVVDLYAAIVERIDDASARRALAREEEERQAVIEQREAAKARRAEAAAHKAQPEEVVFPDPVHELWGDEEEAQAFAEPTPAPEPTREPTVEPDPTAEPSWDDPVADTPESVFAGDDSGEPTIDLSGIERPRRLHTDYKLPDASVLSKSTAAEVEQSALDRMGQTLVEALESFGVKTRTSGRGRGPGSGDDEVEGGVVVGRGERARVEDANLVAVRAAKGGRLVR
ncbi:MAG: hypothetical protein ACKOSO_01700, partial [Actinomycetota bacterium]